jgi:uncharacterized protein (TIGR00730 family)
LLGRHGVGVVYGGGRVGLMGLLADAAVTAGGSVVGIIPRYLEEREVAHHSLTELIVVESMHERKKMMVDRAEAFIVLPGGLGTLDETFEILTWKQLGLHHRPIVLVNIDGYWDQLLSLIQQAIDTGFARRHDGHLFEVVDTVSGVLEVLAGSTLEAEAPSELI